MLSTTKVTYKPLLYDTVLAIAMRKALDNSGITHQKAKKDY